MATVRGDIPHQPGECIDLKAERKCEAMKNAEELKWGCWVCQVMVPYDDGKGRCECGRALHPFCPCCSTIMKSDHGNERYWKFTCPFCERWLEVKMGAEEKTKVSAQDADIDIERS